MSLAHFPYAIAEWVMVNGRFSWCLFLLLLFLREKNSDTECINPSITFARLVALHSTSGKGIILISIT